MAGSSLTWGLQYTYDGFGNLNAQTPAAGTPPSWNYSASTANNRIIGFGYDSNGNMTSTPGPLISTYEYDVTNRLKKVTMPGAVVEEYGYGAGGERLWRKNTGVAGGYEIYFYKDGGERLGKYYVNGVPANNIGFYLVGHDPVLPKGLQAERDRLGSRLLSTTTVYLPYGEEYTPGGGSVPPNGQDKFGTYQRDANTGLDYAVNRYYSSQTGRFLTADPYKASGGPGDPGSWNRYAYVGGDPVNYGDPAGLARCWVERWTNSSEGTLAHVLCQSIGGSQSAEGKWYAVPGIDSRSEQNVLKSAQGEFGHAMDLREAKGYLNVAFGKALEALRDPDCKSIFGEGIKDPITGGGLDPEVVLRGLMHGAHGTLEFADDLGEAVVGEARGVGCG